MTRDSRVTRVQDLTPIVAETLARFSDKPTRFFLLPGVGGRLIRALGRHTGFFEVLGDHCAWIHASFREYFAASYLAEVADIDSFKEYFDRANDPAWRHVLLMLLTLASEKRNLDKEITTMAADGPDGALFAAQAVLEGARVSEPAALETVQQLAKFTLADSGESLCNALLSRGHDLKEDRLRLSIQFSTDPKFAGPTLWLKDSLARNCRDAATLDRRLGWNSQWFDYLRDLNAQDKPSNCATRYRRHRSLERSH
jgi:hypothetical protein